MIDPTLAMRVAANKALYPGRATERGMRSGTEAWAPWLAVAARERMDTTWGIGEGGAAMLDACLGPD